MWIQDLTYFLLPRFSKKTKKWRTIYWLEIVELLEIKPSAGSADRLRRISKKCVKKNNVVKLDS